MTTHEHWFLCTYHEGKVNLVDCNGSFNNVYISVTAGIVGIVKARINTSRLTLAGAAKYTANGGPSVTAEDFKLVGDLFAVGVKSYDGHWVIGDQVVIKQNGKVSGVGIARMNPEEMVSMGRGLAVEVRHHA